MLGLNPLTEHGQQTGLQCRFNSGTMLYFFYKELEMVTFIMQVVNVVLAIIMLFAMTTVSRDERLIPIIMIIIHMLNFCVIGGVLK